MARPPWLVDFLMKHPALVLLLNRYYDWRNRRIRRNHKCIWRVYRDGGGGILVTPRPMRESTAIYWVNKTTGGEVFHVDFDHRMIFYRSVGQPRQPA